MPTPSSPSLRPSPWRLDILLATWFGSGLIPLAPGTMGSLAALPFAWGLMVWKGWPGLAVGAAVVFVVGLWAAAGYIAATGEHDPGSVVIDEVAGQWIALLPAAHTPTDVLVAFVLFRLFDILKPWPVSWADSRLPGALGVMTDDVFAGLFAAAGLWSLQGWAL